MAEIPYEQIKADGARSARWQWLSMGDDDEGSPVIVGERPDGSIQAEGTFAGATVTLEGSNDGVNWFTLTDDQGNPVTFTAAGLNLFIPRPWKIRPTTSGGGGSTINATLLLGS